MRLIHVFAAVLLFATVTQSADPKPAATGLKFLDVAPPVKTDAVVPKVDPTAVQRLVGEQVYHAAASDTPFLIVASRPDLVEIVKEGPVKFRAPWSDIGGKYETRDIKTKFNAFVKAVGTGTVDLLLIPDGAKDEKEIIRKTIDVEIQGSKPPPVDPVTPKVDPKPKGEFRVMLIWDRLADIPEGQLHAINSTKVAEYLDENCAKDSDGRPGWRSWGQDVVFSDKTLKWWKDAWASVKPKLDRLPQIAVFVGTSAQLYALPDSEDKLLQFLKDQKAQAEGK